MTKVDLNFVEGLTLEERADLACVNKSMYTVPWTKVLRRFVFHAQR